MAPPFDPALLRRWIDAAAERLTAGRAEIDRINVFPVADHDTGSNLLLTARAAASAPLEGGPARAAAALAAAAVRGARGNSGLILSQLFRGLAEELAATPAEGTGGAGPGPTGAGPADLDRAAPAGVRDEPGPDVADGPGPGVAARARTAGELLAGALRRAAALATGAVSAPRPGTALTVLEAAASAVGETVAAVSAASGRFARDPVVRTGSDPVRTQRTRADDGSAGSVEGALAEMAEAAAVAARAARSALARVAGRPAELDRAGVVDAGGLGLVVVLDALVAAAGGTPEPVPAGTLARLDGPGFDRTGRPGPPDAGAVTGPGPAAGPGAGHGGAAGPSPTTPAPQAVYEVTYLLDDPAPDALTALRIRLGALGDSVGIAGDGGRGWLVHVHTTEPGAAVEAGLAAGRPSSIRIEALPALTRTRARAVLLMIESSGAGGLARAAGGDVLVADPDPVRDDVVAAIRATGAGHVVVLPCAPYRRTVAETAVEQVRAEGIDAVVVPTVSVLQGLAALAVHDPDRRAAEDVVGMAEAAAGTRTGGLQIAEAEALTWAGPCRPGEVLGISDGEVVLIAPDLAVGALWLAHRMLTPGGELVTVLLGSAADDALGERLAEDLRRTHPEVDVLVHRGDQHDFPLVLGVE
ncbi:DAK2 domain-containing protein [Pseudonocardia sp. NPDC046786]|uniref:DAK2 domain-containing protein n=1 Tax=Pseudonocardia sp. NPDC046786 TaxID=3155471 RepID=UPI0033C93A60